MGSMILLGACFTAAFRLRLPPTRAFAPREGQRPKGQKTDQHADAVIPEKRSGARVSSVAIAGDCYLIKKSKTSEIAAIIRAFSS